MQVELDFLQMSLLVVIFFRTPISRLYICHIPFQNIPCQMFKNLQPSALSAASPVEAEPGARPRGAELVFW
jgi:hypothetical protein